MLGDFLSILPWLSSSDRLALGLISLGVKMPKLRGLAQAEVVAIA